jgi:phage tail-like protein
MTERKDPEPQFNFIVEIDGVATTGFTEVSGLESSIEVIEYREGGEKTSTRKLPGKVTYPNVVLKVGVGDSSPLQAWHQEWVTGAAPKRKAVRIVLLDRARNVKRAWSLHDAWPAKWEGPNLNAAGNDVAIETFELAHEGIESQ